jgi:hypothetical protein
MGVRQCECRKAIPGLLLVAHLTTLCFGLDSLPGLRRLDLAICSSRNALCIRFTIPCFPRSLGWLSLLKS